MPWGPSPIDRPAQFRVSWKKELGVCMSGSWGMGSEKIDSCDDNCWEDGSLIAACLIPGLASVQMSDDADSREWVIIFKLFRITYNSKTGELNSSSSQNQIIAFQVIKLKLFPKPSYSQNQIIRLEFR